MAELVQEGLPMASAEEPRDEQAKELVHRTKVIQFLGCTTPIILQNDNGPCPLLAICDALLLKNNLKLSPELGEVSQEKLLSLVAERLIDSNSNVNNKDAGYVENQQQNITDAIDLLPRLATGIDVNIKFTRIDDFEFTRECGIFDLLDIPLLYHGWTVDPEVNGDTLFMTSNFKEFKVENQGNTTWDEQNAMANTAFRSAIGDSSLQQQEFEQQPQRNLQQPTVSDSSRLVTGPQVPRNSSRTSSVSSKQEAKSSKDKCIVM